MRAVVVRIGRCVRPAIGWEFDEYRRRRWDAHAIEGWAAGDGGNPGPGQRVVGYTGNRPGNVLQAAGAGAAAACAGWRARGAAGTRASCRGGAIAGGIP